MRIVLANVVLGCLSFALGCAQDSDVGVSRTRDATDGGTPAAASNVLPSATGVGSAAATSTVGVGSAVEPGSTDATGNAVGSGTASTSALKVDFLTQESVEKIDLLFVIDNSRSMAAKQVIFQEALPVLINRLVNPVCANSQGQIQATQPSSRLETCQDGYRREFKPTTDINIGVITSSLGDYTGAPGGDCDPTDKDTGLTDPTSGANDRGWLLGTLARGRAALVGSADVALSNDNPLGFLHWGPGSNQQSFAESLGKLVGAAEEQGCGYEATLESWYRFLIDPAPYKTLVKDANGKVGPLIRPDGTMEPDIEILAQRQNFLRPDSLVAVVMFSDENDCSFRAGNNAQYFTDSGVATAKASLPCDANPNDACCYSCLFNAPAGCDAAQSGCVTATGSPARYDVDAADSSPDRERSNLRCFKQKRRFGIDLLYPVQRYINALTKPQLCLDNVELTNNGNCRALVPNPLYDDLTTADPSAKRASRSQSLVFLAGIVGVPWQDLAKDPKSPTLEYRKSIDEETPEAGLNWNWLLGNSGQRLALEPEPLDALLREDMNPRSGMNPALNVALAPVTAEAGANPINGHEWLAADSEVGDLQYACTFELPNPPTCTALASSATSAGCDCAPDGNGKTELMNPVCQQGAAYGNVQYYGRAYPGLRQLQVLHGVDLEEDGVSQKRSGNAVVASICPKRLDNKTASDYGYNPAVNALVTGFKQQLAESCLAPSFNVVQTEQGAQVDCALVEVWQQEHVCEAQDARLPINVPLRNTVVEKLRKAGRCDAVGQPQCEALGLCEIKQVVEPAAQKACMTEAGASGDGWCYVDANTLEAFNLGAAEAGARELVEACPANAKRKLRWLGNGIPSSGTTLLYVCR